MRKKHIVISIVLLLLFVTSFMLQVRKKNSAIIFDGIDVIFQEPKGLVEIEVDTLGEPLPSTKAEGYLPVMIKFSTGGEVLNVYGEMGVQGTSTQFWPKKNWTLKFYSDVTRKNKLRVKIGDSIASDKWIAKAEWVDPTMLRTAISYRLWESMVKSRKTFPKYEVDNAFLVKNKENLTSKTGAQGFPKAYPTIMRVNNAHYGIHILLLGHDPKNFNIDSNNSKHVYMEFDARGGYTPLKTWEKFTIDGLGQWISGYYPKAEELSEAQKKSISNLGDLINGSQKNFEKNFEKYFDKTNMIDMLLFLEVTYDIDAIAQDIEMVTYDLEKWYMLPWDKDTTFGMSWDNKGIIKGSEAILVIDYEKESAEQKPWYKTYHAFKPEVEARYADLRKQGVFSVKNLKKISKGITKNITTEMWKEEELKWGNKDRLSNNDVNALQINTWFEKRLETLDKHFKYKN